MAYIGNSPGNIQRGRRAVYEFTATNAQTVFSGTDDNGISLDLQESVENDVYLNGSRLVFNDDYTIAGEVLTLATGAAAGDILVVVTQDDIANVASYTKTETDARYINYDGDIVNGSIQMGGGPGNNITFADNNKIVMGTGNDLEIYHDGASNHSIIAESGAGSLFLRGQTIAIQNSDGSKAYFGGSGDVATVYHGTSAKLATTSTGIDVTGNVVVSGTVDGRDVATDGTKLDTVETKLDTVETNADVTDATNVAAAGALMTTGGTMTGTLIADDITSDLTLSAIAKDISDTAVDVFVYDTRKDSDGGAWRKRTQHTSWYNETLNTATRGSRKEFPSVAVIVSDSVANRITIYDADDPDMPMWMEFIQDSAGMASTYMVQGSGYDHSVYMLNGILVTGYNNESSSYGQPIINFISEKVVRMDQQADGSEGGIWLGNIADRNTTKGYAVSTEDYDIVNGAVNDIAMTVLPNAPIDSATGLPVPTIYVGTATGVSRIADDGTVSSTTTASSVPITTINVYDGYVTASAQHSTGAETGILPVTTVLSGTGSWLSPSWEAIGGITYDGSDFLAPHAWPTRPQVTGYASNAVATTLGLALLKPNYPAPENGLVGNLTSTYNTGWMNGDIKLATLSSTADTSYTYDHSGITYRDSGRIASHTYTTGATSWDVVDDTGNSGEGYFGLTLPTEDGKQYTVYHTRSVLLTSGSNQNHIQFVSGPDTTATINWGDGSTDLSDSITFTAQGSSVRYVVYSRNNATTTHTINVTLAEQDRSVKKNGLQEYGTVTKTAVATGADLMAYSGFSSSNYLLQPYNSDLDFAADFNITFWYYHVDVAQNEYIVFRAPFDNGTPKTEIFLNPGNQIGCYINDMGGINVNNIAENVWHLISIVRDSGTVRFYVNGEQKVTGSSSVDLTNTSAILSIGKRTAGVYNGIDGKLALFRMSATAPSPEQIKKIYEDEKVLFQENAKATLYGTSDTVTALAYDDTTELLHAGTSSGRSVFQGLRRIDNTTDAVGAAISASNGMVAED